MNFKGLSRLKPWMWLGSAMGVGCALLWQVGVWEPLERPAYNTLMRSQTLQIFPEQEWDDRIAVIAIDEKSIAALGRYPWERQYFTDLLGRVIN